MKQFVEICKCAGKTIESVKHLYFCGTVFLFTDGTYSRLEASACYGGGAEIECGPAAILDCGDEIVTAGIATQEELDACRAEQKRKEAMWGRNRDLAELARLKAAYENK